MLQLQKQCKVCIAVEKDQKLKLRIDKSSYFVKNSRESLKDIHANYATDFGYDAILNHVKVHQIPEPFRIKKWTQQIIAKQARQVAKTEKASATTIWDEIIDTGRTKLKNGEMEMRTSDLLKAVKDKTDYELKKQDQELSMAEMVAYFASGEGSNEESAKYDRKFIEGETAEHFDPALQLAEDTRRRTDESNSFYQSIVRDATASGAN